MILVINKIDCVPSDCMEWVKKYINSFSKHVLTSAVTGQGIQGLETAILEIVGLNKNSVGSRRWTVNQVSYLYISMCVWFFTSIIALLSLVYSDLKVENAFTLD